MFKMTTLVSVSLQPSKLTAIHDSLVGSSELPENLLQRQKLKFLDPSMNPSTPPSATLKLPTSSKI
jgi:hypothetical protein